MFCFLSILPFVSILFLFQTDPFVCFENLDKNESLKLVILIHRHGDRTPISFYPNDPYKNLTNWPDGLGQLTINGKNRLYQRGKIFAKLYKNFLDESPRQVTVQSSAVPRCLESTSVLLAGMFPPSGRWEWNQLLGNFWQPFPIASVPQKYDGMLNTDSECQEASAEVERILSSEEVENYAKALKPFLESLKNYTGYSEMNVSNAVGLYDTLRSEKFIGKTLPEWATEEVYQKLEQIANRIFQFQSMTEKIQRLRAGLLLKSIVQRTSSYKEEQKKVYIYSTHDLVINVLLSALKAGNGLIPPFGATVVLELHKDTADTSAEPYLKVLYANNTESLDLVYPLVLPDCLELDTSNKKICTVENFKKSVQNFIPSDWNDECNNEN